MFKKGIIIVCNCMLEGEGWYKIYRRIPNEWVSFLHDLNNLVISFLSELLVTGKKKVVLAV